MNDRITQENQTDDNYYNTPEGILNANIIAGSSTKLNDALIREYGGYTTGLIMGYGDGRMVDYFKDKFSSLIVIEGSKQLFESASEKYRNHSHVMCFHSYFESFKLPERYKVNTILGNHVLEHVSNPVEVLRISRNWLNQNGYAIFSVPNADSLHRRIGVNLKMLKTRYDLNDQDNLVGHQRVYDQKSLLQDIASGGYKVVEFGGFNLKLVSQRQMKDWSEELIQAIFEISQDCPTDICSNLFVVAEHKEEN